MITQVLLVCADYYSAYCLSFVWKSSVACTAGDKLAGDTELPCHPTQLFPWLWNMLFLTYFPCETCFQEGTSDFGKGVLISEEIRQLLNKVNAALPWWYTGWGASPLLSNKELPAMQEMQETWICSLGWEDPLEEEVATCSSIHTRKISWTEKPGGLWSMGSQRVVHS